MSSSSSASTRATRTNFYKTWEDLLQNPSFYLQDATHPTRAKQVELTFHSEEFSRIRVTSVPELRSLCSLNDEHIELRSIRFQFTTLLLGLNPILIQELWQLLHQLRHVYLYMVSEENYMMADVQSVTGHLERYFENDQGVLTRYLIGPTHVTTQTRLQPAKTLENRRLCRAQPDRRACRQHDACTWEGGPLGCKMSAAEEAWSEPTQIPLPDTYEEFRRLLPESGIALERDQTSDLLTIEIQVSDEACSEFRVCALPCEGVRTKGRVDLPTPSEVRRVGHALRRFYRDFLRQLTEQELQVLTRWTESSRDLQNYLRGMDVVWAQQSNQMDRILSIRRDMRQYGRALNKLVNEAPRLPLVMAVYRGIARLPGQFDDETFEEMVARGQVDEFQSTTIDPNVAIKFAQGYVLLEYIIREGTRAIYLGDRLSNPTYRLEREMLLPRFTKHEYVGKRVVSYIDATTRKIGKVTVYRFLVQS